MLELWLQLAVYTHTHTSNKRVPLPLSPVSSLWGTPSCHLWVHSENGSSSENSPVLTLHVN